MDPRNQSDPTAAPPDPQDAVYESIAADVVETAMADVAAGARPAPPAAEGSSEDIYEETAEKLIEGITHPPEDAGAPA